MIDKDTGTMIITLDSESKPFLRDVATMVLSELDKVPEESRPLISRIRVLYRQYIGIQTIPVCGGWSGLIETLKDQQTWRDDV